MELSNRNKIEEMGRENPYIHRAMQMMRYGGHSYESTLEMLVIALTERGDILEDLIKKNSLLNTSQSITLPDGFKIVEPI